LGQVVELDLLFNSHFLLVEGNHIGLVDHEVRLPNFVAVNVLPFNLHDVLVRLLFEAVPRRLMEEAQSVLLIADKDGIEMREHFEINDGFADGFAPYFEGFSVAIDLEEGNRLLELSRKVESILLLTISQVLYYLVMTKFHYLLLPQLLVVECDLVSCDHADQRKRNYL